MVLIDDIWDKFEVKNPYICTNKLEINFEI